MAEIGDGPIEEDLRKVLDQIDSCLSVLREKIAQLTAAKGMDDE